MAAFLGEKYAIQQEQADAADRLSRANVGAIQQQTALAPDEAAARNYAARAGGFLSTQQGRLTGVNADLAPSLAQSEIGERSAQGQNLLAGADVQRYRIAPNDDITQAANSLWNIFNQRSGSGLSPPQGGVWQGSSVLSPPPGGPPPPGDAWQGSSVLAPHYSEGTSKVPGKGSGKTDTQPAMLAPGEAVLNRGAAEHLGRDTISLLNAIGAHKMGLDLGGPPDTSDTSHPATGSNAGVDNQTGGTQGYAWGTDNVSLPAPGQTVTSGTWGPPPTPNADIRAAVGRPGVPRVMPPKEMGTTARPGYAGGTSNVPAKGAAKPADKRAKGEAAKGREGAKKGDMSPAAKAHTPDGGGLTPGILQALLAMGGGGGPPGAGLPSSPPPGGGLPPGGLSPMPMAMPPIGAPQR